MTRAEILQISKPILFSTLMVQAILKGLKTQTRRVIKPKLSAGVPDGKYRYDGVQEGIHAIELLSENGEPTEKYFSCGKPRYCPGDYIYVRETWAWEPCVHCIMHNTCIMPERRKHDKDCTCRYVYRVDYSDEALDPNSYFYEPDIFGEIDSDFPACVTWKPSIHMPKEAARIFLRVTDVRTERVNDISENDAMAEGCVKGDKYFGENSSPALTAKQSFMWLWNMINEKRGYGWAMNNWVWVYEFERVVL